MSPTYYEECRLCDSQVSTEELDSHDDCCEQCWVEYGEEGL